MRLFSKFVIKLYLFLLGGLASQLNRLRFSLNTLTQVLYAILLNDEKMSAKNHEIKIYLCIYLTYKFIGRLRSGQR